jgi:DnaJ-domain-containing protein 1
VTRAACACLYASAHFAKSWAQGRAVEYARAVNPTLLLPSCLSLCTLGDVLGSLHRQCLSGVLQVIAAEKMHEVELQHGLVVRVTLADEVQRLGDALRRTIADEPHFERVLSVALARSTDARPLGELLLATRGAPARAVHETVQELHQRRLDQLFGIGQARLRFRLFYRPTLSGLVLGPASFLHHRRRHRDRSRPSVSAEPRASAEMQLSAEVQRAYRALGLEPGTELARVRAAFRNLVAQTHPDRFANEGAMALERATRRFRECSASYRLLTDFLSRG